MHIFSTILGRQREMKQDIIRMSFIEKNTKKKTFLYPFRARGDCHSLQGKAEQCPEAAKVLAGAVLFLQQCHFLCR